uniref:Uncharacterized protein n=1 Tax=Heterorhabditis bacteriophora TaxID=37862 RepID=A0A1I7XNT0_HETBA
MGRRKQAKPIKRRLEDYDAEEDPPITKRLNEENMSDTYRDNGLITAQLPIREKPQLLKLSNDKQPFNFNILSVSSPSTSEIENHTNTVRSNHIQLKTSTNPLLMLEKSMKKFEPLKIKASSGKHFTTSTSREFALKNTRYN